MGLTIAEVVHPIALNQPKMLPISTQFTGEYGIRGTCTSVPTTVARAGVIKRHEIELWPREVSGIQAGAKHWMRPTLRYKNSPCRVGVLAHRFALSRGRDESKPVGEYTHPTRVCRRFARRTVMLIVERQARLQELIAQRSITDLDALARELGVSHSTVRRDVEILEKSGHVRRTHGGVMWVSDRTGDAPQPYVFDQRLHDSVEAKRRIARKAASLVEPGQTILIDGGTTTFLLAQELLGRTLQVVTNSLPIATVFQNAPDVELILAGGVLYPRYGVLLGPIADQALASVHASLLFLSVAGVNEGSLFNQNLLLVHAERRMMAQAQRSVLLVDSSKFGQQALVRLGSLDEIDVVVSDAGLTPEQQSQVRAAGCELIIAEG